ncbi:MAG TPA: hypothetical protein VLA34_02730 [Candidatus Krumholzibacterium sp.]|nr:hypothetical protein [Candidatus Krumholzibacterium sp.]
MEKKFIVPAVTFLIALAGWIAFIIMYVKGAWIVGMSPWSEIVLCLVFSGLMVFSGTRCRQVGGPRYGVIIRASVLAVMAIFTFWKVGIIAGIALLAGAIIAGTQACTGQYETDSDEK